MPSLSIPVLNRGFKYFLCLFEIFGLLDILLVFCFEMTNAGLHHLIIAEAPFSKTQSNAISNKFARILVAGEDGVLILMDYHLAQGNAFAFEVSFQLGICFQGILRIAVLTAVSSTYPFG